MVGSMSTIPFDWPVNFSTRKKSTKVRFCESAFAVDRKNSPKNFAFCAARRLFEVEEHRIQFLAIYALWIPAGIKIIWLRLARDKAAVEL